MSYLVLARKWRPRSFDTLVGQDHVVRALTHALESQRLHHAWLFTGTRGVGKTTLSRILAKSLNCEKGITAQPCGQCRACTEIDAGRYVDYVELDAASNRGVDEMTQLLEQAVYAPSSARFKVYMIDEVHMLTGHAFNAMLKTLEEPPPHVKFILATTDPQKIPVTVLSRCLQFNLKHMTVDAIVDHLASVLGQENLPFEAPALRLLGQAAGGSMRDALSLTDQAIAYSAGNLTLDAVQGMLGTIDQRHLLRLLQALSEGRADGVLSVADELAARGLSYSGALGDLAIMLSHIAIQQRVPGALPADDPLAGDVAALAGTLHPDLVQLYYSVAVHSRNELSLAPDEYAGFVMACLRMLSLTPASAVPSEPPPSGRASEQTSSAPQADASPAPAPQAAATPVAALSAASLPAASANKGSSEPASVSALQTPGSATPDHAAPVSARAAQTEAPVVQASGATGQGDDADIPAWEDLPTDPSMAGSPAASDPLASDTRSRVADVDSGAADAVEIADMPPATGIPPATDASPAADIPPATDASSATDLPLATDAPPATDLSPAIDASPATGAALAREPAPTSPPVDAAPAATERLAEADASLPPVETGASIAEEPADAQAFAGGPPDFTDDLPLGPDDYQSADPVSDGEWEPVVDDSGFDAAAQLAPLVGEPASAKVQRPRLARMNAQEWPALAAVLPATGLAAELARQSEWVGAEGDRITLRVAIPTLAARQGQARLRTVLTEHFGKVVQLNVVFGATGDGTAHAVEQVRRAERQKEAETAVANDPFVRSLIEEFGARVMPGSIAALDNEKVA